MYPDDSTRLRHMLDASREALEFTRGKQRADFDRDRQLVLAVLKCIEIVGEASAGDQRGDNFTSSRDSVASDPGNAKSADPRVLRSRSRRRVGHSDTQSWSTRRRLGTSPHGRVAFLLARERPFDSGPPTPLGTMRNGHHVSAAACRLGRASEASPPSTAAVVAA